MTDLLVSRPRYVPTPIDAEEGDFLAIWAAICDAQQAVLDTVSISKTTEQLWLRKLNALREQAWDEATAARNAASNRGLRRVG